MSTKRSAREKRREGAGAPRKGLIRRSRELGGRRFGWAALIVVAVAFILWLAVDLIGIHI